MEYINPAAPVLFPRVEADALAELPIVFQEELARETAVSDRAALERRQEQRFGNNKSPFFRRTPADDVAEGRADDAWLTRLIVDKHKPH